MTAPILALARTRPVLFDGGMGTELMKRGLLPGFCPELWNVENPEAVRSMHADYYAAGSDAVTSNSFGGHPLKLEASGLRDRTAELNAAAAGAVVAARPAGRFVAGSMGPTGRLLKPQGEYTEREFESGFAEQAAALAAGGADVLIVETMFDLREALTALRGALAAASAVPVFVTLTFNRTRRGFFTMMGDPLAASMAELEKAGASAVGANCTLVSSDMIELARELRSATALPLIVQPNAGRPDLGSDGSAVYPQSPEEFASDMTVIAASGVSFLGGCCGTTPEMIRRLAARLRP
ncbi:MAG: homocysteine S-methyltransferase family protein [Acidobacteriota bacterium]|nr:homocysteine S-methyltransferase family protein [Acidobacteriota bacterium]